MSSIPRVLVRCAVLPLFLAFVPAARGETLLRMSSDPGDYVGRGLQWNLTPANGVFTVSNIRGHGVSVRFVGSGHDWRLEFVARDGGLLAPGLYPDARRYPFMPPGSPGMVVAGDGAGCNDITGWFEIRRITWGAQSSVRALWIAFEQHCEGGAPKLAGEIRIDVDSLITIDAPPIVNAPAGLPLRFDVRGADSRGGGVTLTATGVPAGATFTDHGGGVGTFDWPAGSPTPATLDVRFEARSLADSRSAVATSTIHRYGPTLLQTWSDADDYIGYGQSVLYSAADGAFQLGGEYGGAVYTSFEGSGRSWRVDLAPPSGRQLAPATYVAHNHPFQGPTEAGISVSSDSRGCDHQTGAFQIRQITFDGTGNPSSLWAVFEQRCGAGVTAVLRGEIRFNADTSVYVTAPADTVVGEHTPVVFDIRAVDSRGLAVTLDMTVVPAAGTFIDHGDGSGTFTWTGSATPGSFTAIFRARSADGKTAFARTELHAIGLDFLRMQSEPGDYIGLGQSYFYTPSDGALTVSSYDSGYAHVLFVGSDHRWDVEVFAPFGHALRPGIYAGARRYPFQASSEPGIEVSGDSRGCNTILGAFQIRRIAIDPTGAVTSLWATFEQHCEGVPPKITGEIRIAADTSVYAGSPADVVATIGEPVSFDVHATDTRGLGVTLMASGVPSGASFVDHGNGTATFSWPSGGSLASETMVTFTATSDDGKTATSVTAIHVYPPDFLRMTSDPNDWVGYGLSYDLTRHEGTFEAKVLYGRGVEAKFAGSDEEWRLDFVPPFGRLLAPGMFTNARRFPFQATNEPGLDVDGDSRGCNTLFGWFHVRQLVLDGSGGASALWATFEQHCGSGASKLVGEIRINADTALYVIAPADTFVALDLALHVGVQAVSTRGRTLRLAATGLPNGAAFDDHGDGTGTIEWSGGARVPGTYPIVLTAEDSEGRSATATTHVHVVAPLLVDMISDPGDYIGFGERYHFTAFNSTITATRGAANSVNVEVRGLGHDFHLAFYSSNGQPLAAGSYVNGVFASGDARGCNGSTGAFVVRDVVYGSGDRIELFSATFEHHCENAVAALRGQVFFESDALVPALVSLVEGRFVSGSIRLRWFSGAPDARAATLERRTEAEPWRTIATLDVDGAGFLAYVDSDVRPGTRYGYRLRMVREGEEQIGAETWIAVPAAELALEPIHPNPALGEFVVSLDLSAAASGRLEVLDVGGRIRFARDVAGGSGPSTIAVDGSAAYPAGLYFVRLRAAGREVIRRVSVIR